MATNKATVFPELRDTFGVLTTREQKIMIARKQMQQSIN